MYVTVVSREQEYYRLDKNMYYRYSLKDKIKILMPYDY